jgi:hypothetical protein
MKLFLKARAATLTESARPAPMRAAALEVSRVQKPETPLAKKASTSLIRQTGSSVLTKPTPTVPNNPKPTVAIEPEPAIPKGVAGWNWPQIM